MQQRLVATEGGQIQQGIPNSTSQQMAEQKQGGPAHSNGKLNINSYQFTN